MIIGELRTWLRETRVRNPREYLFSGLLWRGAEHVVIGAPHRPAAAIPRTIPSQPPTHVAPWHEWINQSGQVKHGKMSLSRDGPKIILRDQCVAMNNRLTVGFHRPVRDEFSD